MNETYNLKIHLPRNEQDYWITLLEMERDAYNLCSKIVFEKRLKMGLKIVYDNSYNKIRKEIPNLPAQGAIRAIKDVIANYRAVRKNGHSIKKPLVKKGLSIQLDKRLYSNYDRSGINLISSIPYQRIRVPFENLYPRISECFDSYDLSDPRIFYRDGQFYISCVFKVPEKPVANHGVLGVDLGMKMLAVTSDGVGYPSKEYHRYKRRIRHNKKIWKSKIINKKKEFKTNSHSARVKLKKAARKETNYSKNYIHHLANSILKTEKDTIVLEDLSKIKETTKTKRLENGREVKRKRHNNALGQIPFYMLRQVLSYKAPLAGKQVVTVNPANTSKTDSQTGRKSGERVGRRFYSKSGKVYDADWNAAINIAKRYGSRKHPTSWKCPIDGALHLVGKLLSTS